MSIKNVSARIDAHSLAAKRSNAGVMNASCKCPSDRLHSGEIIDRRMPSPFEPQIAEMTPVHQNAPDAAKFEVSNVWSILLSIAAVAAITLLNVALITFVVWGIWRIL